VTAPDLVKRGLRARLVLGLSGNHASKLLGNQEKSSA
jgi:hypothetical protein